MRFHEVTIDELARARKSAYNAVARWGQGRMNVLYAIEHCILDYPLKTRRDVAAMRDKILYQFGEPDYADNFVSGLRDKLLKAI